MKKLVILVVFCIVIIVTGSIYLFIEISINRNEIESLSKSGNNLKRLIFEEIYNLTSNGPNHHSDPYDVIEIDTNNGSFQKLREYNLYVPVIYIPVTVVTSNEREYRLYQMNNVTGIEFRIYFNNKVGNKYPEFDKSIVFEDNNNKMEINSGWKLLNAIKFEIDTNLIYERINNQRIGNILPLYQTYYYDTSSENKMLFDINYSKMIIDSNNYYGKTYPSAYRVFNLIIKNNVKKGWYKIFVIPKNAGIISIFNRMDFNNRFCFIRGTKYYFKTLVGYLHILKDYLSNYDLPGFDTNNITYDLTRYYGAARQIDTLISIAEKQKKIGRASCRERV